MIRFDYHRPEEIGAALQDGAGERTAYLAGGTNLVDLLKENVARPTRIVEKPTEPDSTWAV